MCHASHLLENFLNRPAKEGEELEIRAFRPEGHHKMVHALVSPDEPDCIVCVQDGIRLELTTPVQARGNSVREAKGVATFIELSGYPFDLLQFYAGGEVYGLTLDELPLGTTATVLQHESVARFPKPRSRPTVIARSA